MDAILKIAILLAGGILAWWFGLWLARIAYPRRARPDSEFLESERRWQERGYDEGRD